MAFIYSQLKLRFEFLRKLNTRYLPGNPTGYERNLKILGESSKLHFKTQKTFIS